MLLFECTHGNFGFRRTRTGAKHLLRVANVTALHVALMYGVMNSDVFKLTMWAADATFDT